MRKATEDQTEKGGRNLDWYLQQPLEVQLEIVRNCLEISLIVFNQLMENEVCALTGKRYSRDRPHGTRYQRWGSNPGSVQFGTKRVPVDVPRVYDTEKQEHRPLESYTQMRDLEEPSESLLQAILYGVGTRNHGRVVDSPSPSFGLSKSEVSETFKEQSSEALRVFMERRFDAQTFVALMLDGKAQHGAQMVIALGVTRDGTKIPMGFVQATTENAESCSELLRDILRRGLTFETGLLVCIDGAKGLRKGVEDVFGAFAVVMRCQFHKRKNIIRYLPESEQKVWNSRLRTAMALPDEKEARRALEQYRDELRKINVSAATSLEEGLDEYLTLQRLGINPLLYSTFSSTNCIENLNSQIQRYTRNVTHWSTSDQRHRWMATALLESVRKTKRIDHFEILPSLQAAVAGEVNKRLEKQQLDEISTLSTSRISTKKRA